MTLNDFNWEYVEYDESWCMFSPEQSLIGEVIESRQFHAYVTIAYCGGPINHLVGKYNSLLEAQKAIEDYVINNYEKIWL